METPKRTEGIKQDMHRGPFGMLRNGASEARSMAAHARKHAVEAAVAAAMAATLIGCGGGPGTNAVARTNVNTSDFSVSSPASAIGGTLLLPDTIINNSTVTNITFKNDGTSTVNITNCSLGGASTFATTLSSCIGSSVAVGSTAVYPITFSPTVAGPYKGAFTIDYNSTSVTEQLDGYGVTQPKVVLTWVASTSQVSGYNIYRSDKNGGPYAMINISEISCCTYTDDTAQLGETYYYVATAETTEGIQSMYSGQATAQTPTISAMAGKVSNIVMKAKVTIPRDIHRRGDDGHAAVPLEDRKKDLGNPRREPDRK